MNNCCYRWLLMMLALGLSKGLCGQISVYPGDANNNGIVNNIDVLYIGYGFGTPGPSRVLTDTEFEPQNVPAAWSATFPDNTSFAYADANGDGIISTQDLLAVNRNYGAIHPPVTPDEFPEAPEEASRLHMERENEPIPLIPGSAFSIPLYLNDLDHPEELNGLAFSLEYDDQIIKDIRLEWAPNWFNADSSWYGLQQPVIGEKARLDIAATRFGNDPIVGGGLLGKLNIIIEDDLIGLLIKPTDSLNVLVAINKIRGVGKDFLPVLLGGDKYTFTVFHPDARPNQVKQPQTVSFKLFPNPAREILYLKAPETIQSVLIQDLLGRPLSLFQNLMSADVQLSLPDLPPGVYLVKIQTEKGIGCRELVVE